MGEAEIYFIFQVMKIKQNGPDPCLHDGSEQLVDITGRNPTKGNQEEAWFAS